MPALPRHPAFDSADATLGTPAPAIENVDQVAVVQTSLPKQPKLNELRPPFDTPSQFGRSFPADKIPLPSDATI